MFLLSLLLYSRSDQVDMTAGSVKRKSRWASRSIHNAKNDSKARRVDNHGVKRPNSGLGLHPLSPTTSIEKHAREGIGSKLRRSGSKVLSILRLRSSEGRVDHDTLLSALTLLRQKLARPGRFLDLERNC